MTNPISMQCSTDRMHNLSGGYTARAAPSSSSRSKTRLPGGPTASSMFATAKLKPTSRLFTSPDCSARLQASMCLKLKCPPEGGLYKTISKKLMISMCLEAH